MTDKNQLNNSKENGKKVWESMLNQLTEVHGFILAFMQSLKEMIKKHFLLAFVFGILGAMVFVGYYYTKPKVYVARMTVSYNDLAKKIYADMLVKIDALVKAENYEELSGLLKLPTSDIENIVKIESFNIHNEPLTEDLSTEHIPFYIEVKTKNTATLEGFEKAIIAYMNSSDYLLKRKEYLLSQNEAELVFLNNRMTVLDSLSKLTIVNNSTISQQDAQKEIDFNKEILELHSKIKVAKSAIKFNNNIEILDGFVANNKPIGNSLKYYIILGFALGLGFRILVVFFKSPKE